MGDTGPPGPPGTSGGTTWSISNGRCSTSYYYYYHQDFGYTPFNSIGCYDQVYICNDDNAGSPGWNSGYGSIFRDRYAEACDGFTAR